ncbi:molybdopterin molybdenumtransferase [Paenibacillus sp. FSL P4-0081]|jgi:molybdopterin molybdotransferase|uniref:molybdopterin molybdotransferase MoeA n=1 Tax=Paenibacillus sp. FSL P4-0081 TaxID=1536769 RepID=UPI0004F82931|nr:gephyrin-like molybdotransferase Glp [Paenibacillus sp. FSL P4-0081]AIQ28264.1 molybdopterin molybdenumtransferase [Paenibacillus sp. FSL P4-0081]
MKVEKTRNPVTVAEAVFRVTERVCCTGTERVPLAASYGRILAEPLTATHDVPHFTRSPYDGYAIASADSVGASGNSRISFTVVDHIGAGEISQVTLGAFEAVRLMTGAALPAGADAVVMFEQASEAGRTFTIRKAFAPQENLSLQGEDMRSGERIVPAGSFIHPGTVALLATFGYGEVRVGKRPVVGILSTGTELLEVTAPLVPGRIRNSNGPMIAAQLARMGIPYRMYDTAADQLEECLLTVRQAMTETDCLITTGGVSVGDYDYLPEIYKRLGADVLFNKVAMRPGSVTTVAVAGEKCLFGLSGNPSACFTGFELFVRPALLTMMGADKVYLPRTTAVLAEDFPKANPFTRFIRAVHDRTSVRPAGFNKSNAVSSIARGNSLIVLPGGTRGYAAGDPVDVLLLGVEEGTDEWVL